MKTLAREATSAQASFHAIPLFWLLSLSSLDSKRKSNNNDDNDHESNNSNNKPISSENFSCIICWLVAFPQI